MNNAAHNYLQPTVYVSVDPARLQKDDPILAIERPEFHDPVRTFVEEVRSALDETDDIEATVGIVLFGSVARGEADRRSDIDPFVVVDGDRTGARRCVTDVVGDLRERRFGGDRFDFDLADDGVEVRHVNYEEMIHGFASSPDEIDRAREAIAEVADHLTDAFASS